MGGSSGGPDTVTQNSTGSGTSNQSSSGSSQFSGFQNVTYPPYVLPYAQDFLQAYSGLAMPGGNIAASPYPYSEVAPMTVPQLQGAQAIGAFGQTSPLITGAERQQANTIAGNYLSPNVNPYLKQYYDAAADALTQQYKYATDPSLLAHGAQTGTLVSSGATQANQLARYNLGQNLANLAAGIYEPAYQFERGQQTSAAQQGAPGLTAAQYTPAHELMGLGTTEQQQMQNIFNSAFQNLQTLGLWPYQALNLYGSAFGPANGPGQSVTYGGQGTTAQNITGSFNSSGSQTGPNPFQTSGVGGGLAGLGGGALGSILGGLLGGGGSGGGGLGSLFGG